MAYERQHVSSEWLNELTVTTPDELSGWDKEPSHPDDLGWRWMSSEWHIASTISHPDDWGWRRVSSGWHTALAVGHPDGHDDVIKWKHFPRYWPFVRGIHRSPVNSPHKGLWRGALMFSLICAWIEGWVNNGEAGDLRRYHVHYNVTVMESDVIRII